MDPIAEWLNNHDFPVRTPRASDSTELINQPLKSYNDETNYSDPNVEIFRNPKNHVGAVASVLSKCATDTDFFPDRTLNIPDNVFDNYMRRVSTFPAFTLESTQNYTRTTNRNDVKLYISQLTELYTGIVGVDVGAITNAVESMLNSMLNSSTDNQSLTKFNQGSIANVESGVNTIKLVFMYTNLVLDKRENGKKNVEAQTYVISRVVYMVNTSVLVANAQRFSDEILVKSVDDWFKSSTSPGAGIVTKNCLNSN
jgi:hypothetical protein